MYSSFVLPYGIYIISSRPKMSVPILALQVCVLIEYHQCTFTLQISHKLRYCHMWRYFDQHMYVIRAALCFYDIDVSILTQLSQYLSYVRF